MYAFAHKRNFRQFVHTFFRPIFACTHFAVVENQPLSFPLTLFSHPLFHLVFTLSSLSLARIQHVYWRICVYANVYNTHINLHRWEYVCGCVYLRCTRYKSFFFLSFPSTGRRQWHKMNTNQIECFMDAINRWWTERGSVERASETGRFVSKIDREGKCVWLMIAPICNKINYTLNVMIPSRAQSSLNISLYSLYTVFTLRDE